MKLAHGLGAIGAWFGRNSWFGRMVWALGSESTPVSALGKQTSLVHAGYMLHAACSLHTCYMLHAGKRTLRLRAP